MPADGSPAPAAQDVKSRPQRARRWLKRRAHSVAELLALQVSFERRGRSLHIVLRRKSTVRSAAAAAAAQRAIDEAAPLRQALKQLLDRHPLSRRLMRHLTYVEHALAKQGLGVFAEMPVDVLSVALDQIDALVINWSDRELADLRSRMAVAYKERTLFGDFDPAGVDGRSAFTAGSRLMVEEASHSVFQELERQYKAVLPQEVIESALASVHPEPDEAAPEVTCSPYIAPDAGAR
ncbi:MAG TPA: hypothetical protein VIN58_11645 [Roseateles sp.]